MAAILELLWAAAVQSSVLFAAIWLMRLALKGRVNPRLQYALWSLMLLRLLLPLGVQSPLSVMNAVEPATEIVRQFTAPSLPGTSPALLQGAPDTPAGAVLPGLPHLLIGLWITGMAVVAVWMVVTNLKFRRLAMRGAKTLRHTREHQRALLRCGIRRSIPLYVTKGVPSPCLVGLLRPMVLLTPESAALPGRLHHILLHELCHLRQRDNWIALLRNIVCVIHWYNPLVWIAARLSRQDCELACDAAVLQLLARGEELVYGETLVRLIRSRATTGTTQLATTMAAGKREMKERLNMIVRQPRTVALAAAATVVLSAVLAATACTGAVKEEDALAAPPAVSPSGQPALESAAPSPSAAPSTAQPTATETSGLQDVPTGLPAQGQDGLAEGDTLLWQQGGWAYVLRSREGEEILSDGKLATPGERVGRLLRVRAGERQVLDELVNLGGGRATVLPAGDRIIFIGFASTKKTDLKVDGVIVSINLDGTGRTVFAPKSHVAGNLCVDKGYLYYEGWTNGGAFPRPINRLNADLKSNYKMADIEGAFITAHQGYAYYVHRKGNRIDRLKLDWKSAPEQFATCGISANFTVTQTGENEYLLTDTNENKEPYQLILP